MSIGLVTTVVGLLVDSVEVVRLGKELKGYLSRRKSSDERIDIPSDQEDRMKSLIGGVIGSKLVDAFISYVESGDPGPMMEVIDGVERRKEVSASIDVIGRNPEVMYRRQFGRDPDYIYKYVPDQGGLSVKEFPLVAFSSAKFLELINNLHPSAKKRLILSAPVILGFQIGQLVGTTAKFYPLHLVRESGYAEVSPVVRY